jgi:hypothetical protein
MGAFRLSFDGYECDANWCRAAGDRARWAALVRLKGKIVGDVYGTIRAAPLSDDRVDQLVASAVESQARDWRKRT